MRGKRVPSGVLRAFDEAHFGDARTLNLRDRLPTGPEAAARAEAWLRSKQVEGVREVLIITGRGANSVGGLPVVRPHVVKRLSRLKGAGVVGSVVEHSPGSFVVRLAPVSSMLTAASRIPHPRRVKSESAVPALSGLTQSTQQLVREVAVRTLASLGVQRASRTLLADEVERQAQLLAAAMPQDVDREAWIRNAALGVLNELE